MDAISFVLGVKSVQLPRRSGVDGSAAEKGECAVKKAWVKAAFLKIRGCFSECGSPVDIECSDASF